MERSEILATMGELKLYGMKRQHRRGCIAARMWKTPAQTRRDWSAAIL